MAGVSPSTVSRVLSGKASTLVSATTQERVREAAQQLGYRPSAAARALATGRANTIAFCCYPVYDSGMAQLIRAVHDVATAAGYHLLLVDHHQTDQIRELLIEQRVDAVVWTQYPLHHADELVDCLGAPHQIVVAIGEIEEAIPQHTYSAVWSDRQGLRLLLEHLAALGHRQIAFLGGSRQTCPSKPRAFTLECVALGLQGELIWVDDESDRRGAGMAMAQQVLQLDSRPTALVSRSNDFALGAIHALQQAGLRVPEDMSVTGYHDSLEARYSHPPLTSVQTPEYRGVATVLPAALAALQENPGRRAKPNCVPLDVEIVIRASTAPPPGNI